MARRPNEDLLKLRDTFGVNPEFLLSDLNEYTMDAPVEEIDDGIASINTDLPIYVKDGNDNNFFQYSSMDGAPGYIKPTEIDAPVNSFLKGPEFYQNNAMTEKEYADRISKIREYNKNLDSSYTDEELREIINLQNQKKPEKTGILKSIKDKGFDILDFIKSGGISGAIAKTILGPQDPRATFLRDYYGGEDGSNIKDGTIQSGLMAGYNPVSGGFLNTISRDRFGQPTTYGLQNAYDRRIATILKTLATKYKDGNYDDTLLDERLAKLREEKRKEAEALKTQFNREEQRYRDDPGAKSYSGGFDKSTNNYNDPFDPGETE